MASRISSIPNPTRELDESTRLLPDAEHGGTTEASRVRGPTPFPKTQLGVLMALRIIDAIAYTQILPYINQFLADLHIAAPERAGLYSAFIGSAYSVAEMLSVYQWGRLSDIIGRRPVVISCLVGIAVSTVAFGFSTSLVMILASRFLCGLATGNVAVHHSILAEITDDSNQSIAVPMYILAWSIGTVMGNVFRFPLIGETFGNAATRYPRYFSWILFVDHPYLLPCIITAMCALLGIVLGYFLLGETLPSNGNGPGDSFPGRTPRFVANMDTTSESMSVKALLAIPPLRALALSGLVLGFLSSAFDIVFTLLCYITVDAGGLGVQPSAIGNFRAFSGTFAVLLQLVAMPYILYRFDHATTYYTCMCLWPIAFVSLPLLNVLARARPPAQSASSYVIGTITTTEMGLRIGLALVLALSRVAAIPFSITMLLVKRHAPSYSVPSSVEAAGRCEARPVTMSAGVGGTESTLGRSNGLVQLAMSLGRLFSPPVVSTVLIVLNGAVWAKGWGVTWAWSVIMMCVSMVGVKLAKEI